MPRRVSQVSTERILTWSMPASSMMRTFSSVISSPEAHQHLAGVRVEDVVDRDAAQDAVAELLDDLAALDQRAELDAVDGAAVVLGDDAVLRHVDETAGEVPRVRRLERGVGQTLAGAVRRDEVLEHRQPLAEVGGDRRLDDLARRLGHEAAHAGQLANLLRRTTRARVGHDVDRVERRAAPLLAGLVVDELLGADLAHHLFGDLLRDLRPDVDDLVVALAVGDETLGVLLLDLLRRPSARSRAARSCAPGSADRRRRSRCRPWSRRCSRATAACRPGGRSPSGRRRGSSCR